MGMFDRIYLIAKCPRCGDEGGKEFQTKDLNCDLNEYGIGDSVSITQYRWLWCIASCVSDACLAWEQDRWQGRSHGFGFCWSAAVEVDERGLITGTYRNIDTERE